MEPISKYDHTKLVQLLCCTAYTHQKLMVLRVPLNDGLRLFLEAHNRWYKTGLTANTAQTPSFDMFHRL